MTPRTVKNVLQLRRKMQRQNLTDIYVFDIDNTILETVGTYEQDYNLDKFQRDNTFIRNLGLKKLPCFYAISNYFDKVGKYGTRNLVVIQTARSRKWWLALILWIKGVKYDVLLQRPRANNMDSLDNIEIDSIPTRFNTSLNARAYFSADYEVTNGGYAQATVSNYFTQGAIRTAIGLGYLQNVGKWFSASTTFSQLRYHLL